jgi:hypothetical protein
MKKHNQLVGEYFELGIEEKEAMVRALFNSVEDDDECTQLLRQVRLAIMDVERNGPEDERLVYAKAVSAIGDAIVVMLHKQKAPGVA